MPQKLVPKPAISVRPVDETGDVGHAKAGGILFLFWRQLVDAVWVKKKTVANNQCIRWAGGRGEERSGRREDMPVSLLLYFMADLSEKFHEAGQCCLLVPRRE